MSKEQTILNLYAATREFLRAWQRKAIAEGATDRVFIVINMRSEKLQKLALRLEKHGLLQTMVCPVGGIMVPCGVPLLTRKTAAFILDGYGGEPGSLAAYLARWEGKSPRIVAAVILEDEMQFASEPLEPLDPSRN